MITFGSAGLPEPFAIRGVVSQERCYTYLTEAKMASIYWSGEKAPEEVVKKALMSELPDYTDTAFYVKKESDDTSTHMSVYVEKEDPNDNTDFPWKKVLPPKFMGWRIIIIFVNRGYIKGVLDAPAVEWD